MTAPSTPLAGTGEPTVAARLARALVRVAVRLGVEREALLAEAELAASALDREEQRIPFGRYRQLLLNAGKLSGKPSFPLLFGEAVTLGEVSSGALASQTSLTVEEGLRQYNRYWRLMIDDGGRGPAERVVIRKSAHGACMEVLCHPSIDYPEITETLFARMACGYRRRFGGGTFARRILVTHKNPGYRTEYDRIFGAPTFFESDRNALYFDEVVLGYTIPTSNSFAHGIFRKHAEEQLERLEKSRTTRGQVERLLVRRLPSGEIEMEGVAEALGLSRQTLYRRLRQEGVTYGEVVEALRRELAVAHLRDQRPVKEVAYQLGYSEPSAFSRAFHRWMGIRPARFLAQLPSEE